MLTTLSPFVHGYLIYNFPLQITPQQVDFWELYEAGTLEWKIDRKHYPPHFTIDVGQVTLSICMLQFSGVLPGYNLDTEILFQVTSSGGKQISSCYHLLGPKGGEIIIFIMC